MANKEEKLNELEEFRKIIDKLQKMLMILLIN
jgi:hypothetical protein